jgi:hypothetical protein
MHPLAPTPSTTSLACRAARRLLWCTRRYVEYAAVVYRSGQYVTTAWKRYKSFNRLHRDLVSQLGSAAQLPQLPPKIRGQGRHPVVVGERQEQLCRCVRLACSLARMHTHRSSSSSIVLLIVAGGGLRGLRYINELLRCVPVRWKPTVDRFLHLDRPSLPLPNFIGGGGGGATAQGGGNGGVGGDDNYQVYDPAEVEHAQRVIAECHDLVAELTECVHSCSCVHAEGGGVLGRGGF